MELIEFLKGLHGFGWILITCHGKALGQDTEELQQVREIQEVTGRLMREPEHRDVNKRSSSEDSEDCSLNA